MSQRSLAEFLTDHAPITGILIRAGGAKSPRSLARLWHDDSDTTPDGVVVVGGFDASDIAAWESHIDSVISDAGSPGPCKRVEVLAANGKAIASWQRTQALPPELGGKSDSLSAAIHAMALAMTGIIGEVRQLVVVQNTTIASLGEALVARDDRLYGALDAMTDAHREAANATLEAALMVVESTTSDPAPADTDNSHLTSVLSAVASNLGVPIPGLPGVTPTES